MTYTFNKIGHLNIYNAINTFQEFPCDANYFENLGKIEIQSINNFNLNYNLELNINIKMEIKMFKIEKTSERIVGFNLSNSIKQLFLPKRNDTWKSHLISD